MSDEQLVVRVQRDDENSKYDAWLGDEVVGMVVYERGEGRILLTHAAVSPGLQHHGIGHQLISQTLDDIRAREIKATIICPVVREFLDRHPEYDDVVDPRQPGVKSNRSSEAGG